MRKSILIGCVIAITLAVSLIPLGIQQSAEFVSPRPKTIVAEFVPPSPNIIVVSNA